MSDSVRAIEGLIYRYAELQDQSDLPAVAALFEHGAFVVDKVPGSAVGTDGVLAFKQRHDRLYPDGTLRTKHVTTNVVIEADDDRGVARARSYFTVLQATDRFPLQVIMAGRYDDSFHRIDGRWWFNQRLVLTDLIGDMSSHTMDSPMVMDG
jgi:3-phenylpropionate/cinnamic acid dioxygenase small subunit